MAQENTPNMSLLEVTEKYAILNVTEKHLHYETICINTDINFFNYLVIYSDIFFLTIHISKGNKNIFYPLQDISR